MCFNPFGTEKNLYESRVEASWNAVDIFLCDGDILGLLHRESTRSIHNTALFAQHLGLKPQPLKPPKDQ